jgi:hypothetical protein
LVQLYLVGAETPRRPDVVAGGAAAPDHRADFTPLVDEAFDRRRVTRDAVGVEVGRENAATDRDNDSHYPTGSHEAGLRVVKRRSAHASVETQLRVRACVLYA